MFARAICPPTPVSATAIGMAQADESFKKIGRIGLSRKVPLIPTIPLRVTGNTGKILLVDRCLRK